MDTDRFQRRERPSPLLAAPVRSGNRRPHSVFETVETLFIFPISLWKDDEEEVASDSE